MTALRLSEMAAEAAYQSGKHTQNTENFFLPALRQYLLNENGVERDTEYTFS